MVRKLFVVSVLALLLGGMGVWYAYQPMPRTLPTPEENPTAISVSLQVTQHNSRLESRPADSNMEAEIDAILDEAINVFAEWMQEMDMERKNTQSEAEPPAPSGPDESISADMPIPDIPNQETEIPANPEPIRFTFDEGLEGWEAGISGKHLDSVTQMDSGSIRLDGSDAGHPDGLPNSWISRELELPGQVTTLRFSTSTHPRRDANAELRVRLVDQNQVSHTLLDWELGVPGIEGEMTWIERDADLSAFAGQTVTLFFEQGDNDIGRNEERYIDNITIE